LKAMEEVIDTTKSILWEEDELGVDKQEVSLGAESVLEILWNINNILAWTWKTAKEIVQTRGRMNEDTTVFLP
jgi:hypothetical protein